MTLHHPHLAKAGFLFLLVPGGKMTKEKDGEARVGLLPLCFQTKDERRALAPALGELDMHPASTYTCEATEHL